MVVLEKEQILNLVDDTVDLGLRKGATEVEVYFYEGHAKNIVIERGQITKSNKILDRGLGIRVTQKKSIGFAYTNDIQNSGSIQEVILNALHAAKASKPDKDWSICN